MSLTLDDLQTFCSTDSDPRYREIQRPFSRGDWTWATDGHLIIRVPRLQAVSEGAAVTLKIIEDTIAACRNDTTRPIGTLPEPTTIRIECDHCNGTGRKHDSPCCNCECSECDGDGWLIYKSDDDISVSIHEVPFDVGLFRKLSDLPNLRVQAIAEPKKPLYLRFDGGEGLLMPLSMERSKNIRI
jgi:hypothetical protein